VVVVAVVVVVVAVAVPQWVHSFVAVFVVGDSVTVGVLPAALRVEGLGLFGAEHLLSKTSK